MEIGTVRQVDIEEEMQQAYLDYAMSVIVSRALPDVRDGLKPVQRRILYAMHDMGLSPDRPYKKSARIVGEVLGKYHPHGDVAVYDAMVRMAQDFSMRYALVDGQGNFGSVDGDSAAAMRYTEARMQVIADELVRDIGKETVDFVPNFDGTLTEPSVLPSALPNLLVNGASGIAVGMATNIPPHNLGEVCDALMYLIDHWKSVEDVAIGELLQFIQGPDFPTGGIVYRYGDGAGAEERVDVIESAYAVGRGRFTVQAKAHVEEMTRNRHRIVVTELPYQVNKARLVERIAELARDGKIEGISDLRDESDRQGLRVAIELTRTVDPREVLAQLYKLTPMQMTFGMRLLALVDGEPRLLSLRKILQLFLEHRREIITRRSQYDLERARLRAHILEGLLVALANLDEVIALIRRSRTADTAKANLQKRFRLTEIQAQAILDMQLRRLAALERQKIEDEYQEKKKLIAYLEDLLAHPAKIMGVIRDELKELKSRYADPRRTQIVEREKRELTTRDLVAEQDVIVLATDGGKLRYYPVEEASAAEKEAGNERIVAIATGNTRDDLLICADGGMAYVLPVYRLPGGDRAAWTPLGEVTGSGRKDNIAGLVCLARNEEGQWPGYLTLVTRQGRVKRILAEDLRALRGEGVVIGLDEGDTVLGAFLTTGDQTLLLCTVQGQGIHFAEEDVRPMGLSAGGVMAIKLAEGDAVLGALPGMAGAQVALLTREGYGKRTPVSDFPAQKRYGAGVIAYKVTDKTGPVSGMALAGKAGLTVYTSKGRSVSVSARSLPATGRATMGKVVVRLRKGEEVIGVVSLAAATAAAEKPTRTRRAASASPAKPAKKTAAKPSARAKQAAGETGKKASAKATDEKKPARSKSATATPEAASKARPTGRAKKAGTTEEKAPLKKARAKKTTDTLEKSTPAKETRTTTAKRTSAPKPKAAEKKPKSETPKRTGKGTGAAKPAPASPAKKKRGGAASSKPTKSKRGIVQSVTKPKE